jgi:phosphoribosylaminoimidazole-succinocarboxamide synthase
MHQFSPSPPLFDTRISSLQRVHQGKVRDIYDVDAEHLLFVATDRLSAFDVVLPDPIPFKGEVLTRISEFWFERTASITPNHLSRLRVEDVVSDAAERAQLIGRAMVVKKLAPLPVEAVARGYLMRMARCAAWHCHRACRWPGGCPSRYSRPPSRLRPANMTRTSTSML